MSDHPSLVQRVEHRFARDPSGSSRPAPDLAAFIAANLDTILAEWEDFARTLLPAAGTLDPLALRDHAKEILEAIAADIVQPQTARESREKSKGHGDNGSATGGQSAASLHGDLRHASGFDLRQLFAEYRALRASVLRLWARAAGEPGREALDQVTRFNEGIDQALADSVGRYADNVARSRETFMAVLGDDLRGPLEAVKSAADTLAHPQLEAAARMDGVAQVRSAAASIDRTVRNLLEYTRSRLGRAMPIKTQVERIGGILRAATAEVQVGWPQSSLRIETGTDLFAACDAPRLQQAVVNLLTNAIVHGRRGSVVRLVAREEGGALLIEVSNEGPAIAPRDLQVIFDPLLRAAAAPPPADRPVRLGLGLFIAREIALAHRGGIEAASSDARTTFTLSIPQRAAAAARW